MGGEWFETESEGATVDEAFNKAVEQAIYDYGHSGYSGTIKEKDGFKFNLIVLTKEVMELLKMPQEQKYPISISANIWEFQNYIIGNYVDVAVLKAAIPKG